MLLVLISIIYTEPNFKVNNITLKTIYKTIQLASGICETFILTLQNSVVWLEMNEAFGASLRNDSVELICDKT